MNRIWERADARAAAPAVLERLQSGEAVGGVAAALGLDPPGLIAALAQAGLGDDDLAGAPALVQESPRRPWLRPALEESVWAELLPRASRPSRLALAAGLLQIHDFWDSSHEAAQQADDLGERAVSAYWHGIAHRREPDPGNASYWFRRVGRHAVFEPLAQAARPLLEESGASKLAGRLLPRGSWDPFAFIGFCSEGRRGSPEEELARSLQRLEMIVLLSATANAVVGEKAG